MTRVVHVGMDVDKEKIVAAKLDEGAGGEVEERVIANKPSAVKKYFAELIGSGDVMAAPGLIPRKPSDRVKTDRRDAKTLAFALRAGQLTGVHIPSKHDEAVRDYLRMYGDLRSDLRKAKQRVLHFLLRRGMRYQEGSNWTLRHKEWLNHLKLESQIDRQSLEMYLAHLLELERKCAEVASVAEKIGEQECYREPVRILCAFKGVKTLTALSFICEIGDFRRFATAGQFMAFLGLVPSERSSGDKRRHGGING